MRKIDAYRVKSGTNLGSSKFWNAILEDVDLRIHARELDVEKIDKAADELIAVGVDRVNSTFNPLIQQSTQAVNDATALLEAAQAQVAATINEVNEELQTFLDETASQVQAILAGGIDAGTFEEPSGGKVRVLRSTIAGHAPASLEPGEFAVNHADGLVFFRNADGSVGSIGLLTLATQAWVTAQFDALKGGVSAAYDTLQEIAAWIANDETAEAAITTALGNRLRFDTEQALTAGQKTQLFTNAGLGAAAALAAAVAADIRANSGNALIGIDKAWEAAGWVNLGNVSGSVTINLNTGSCFYGTMTGNITALSFSNGKSGQPFAIELWQDGAGGRTVSYTAGKFLFPNNSAPTISTVANTLAVLISGKVKASGTAAHAVGWKES